MEYKQKIREGGRQKNVFRKVEVETKSSPDEDHLESNFFWG